MNSRGPRIDPCGTPQEMEPRFEFCLPFNFYEDIQSKICINYNIL